MSKKHLVSVEKVWKWLLNISPEEHLEKAWKWPPNVFTLIEVLKTEGVCCKEGGGG